jgi:hypothetical protein
VPSAPPLLAVVTGFVLRDKILFLSTRHSACEPDDGFVFHDAVSSRLQPEAVNRQVDHVIKAHSGQ